MHRIMRLLLDAPETAPAGRRRRSPVATTVSIALTVVAPGAALRIQSAAPPPAPLQGGRDGSRPGGGRAAIHDRRRAP
jgi:hypothetical protein